MLSSLLLLDFFGTSPPPQGYQHTVYLCSGLGLIVSFTPVCVSCPVRHAGTVSSGQEVHLKAEGLTSWGSGAVLKPGALRHIRGGIFQKHFCFRKPTYIPVPKSSVVHVKAGTQGFPNERRGFTS